MEIEINSKKYGVHKVFFDETDFFLIKDYTWHINYHGKNVYAISSFRINGIRKDIKMHRLIMGFPKFQIDHIDNNGLNNCRNNLRLTTHEQNQKNKRSYRNSTGYSGVCFSKKMNRFQAQLKSNGKTYWGGYFNTAIEAAKKYNELAVKYNGEFAKLNQV